MYALQIYHEISVDITDIRDIHRYLKVLFYENISSKEISTDICGDISRYPRLIEISHLLVISNIFSDICVNSIFIKISVIIF